jgi:hypothetical protein
MHPQKIEERRRLALARIEDAVHLILFVCCAEVP